MYQFYPVRDKILKKFHSSAVSPVLKFHSSNAFGIRIESDNVLEMFGNMHWKTRKKASEIWENGNQTRFVFSYKCMLQ